MTNQMQKFYDNLFKRNNEALRNIFKKEIKPNFLIELKSKIIEKLGNELPKLFNLNPNYDNVISGNQDLFFEFEICKHIVGVHSSYSLFLLDDERIKNEKSDTYKEKIINEVILNLKLRNYGSSYFRNTPITYGERFIYFPIPYDLFVISNRMNYILATNKNNFPFLCFYISISNKSLATLSLLEDNLFSSAYPLCRGIIELYIKLLILSKSNQKTLNEYSNFINYDMYRREHKEYPKEFNEKYNNRIKDDCSVNDYLNYGWVDYIPNYHTIVTKKQYSFYGLLNYLKTVYKNMDITFNSLSNLYQLCNGYTHGNIESGGYPLIHYFEISMILSGILINTYSGLCKILNQDTKIENIDIIEKTQKDYKLFEKKYREIDDNKLQIHYTKLKNKLYSFTT